jgi:hypothetical protein
MTRFGNRRRRRLRRDAAYGAVAGIVGTLAMDSVTDLLYKLESEEKRRKEESLRTEGPAETLAARLIEFVGAEPSGQRKKRIAQILHWGYGAAWGTLFGILHHRAPALSRASGFLFGVLFFLAGDELMNGVMGLTPPPKEFPIDAHVRGLVAHVVFAAAADGTIRIARAVMG